MCVNGSLRLKFEGKGPSDGRGRRRRVVQVGDLDDESLSD